MNTCIRHFALLSLLVVFIGCGNQDPRQVLIGSWGVDLSAVEDEGAALDGAMAKRMHERKLDAMRGIRVTFGAEGTFACEGLPGFAGGSYTLEQVEGNRASLRIIDRSLPPTNFDVEVHSSNRMSMTSGDKALFLTMLRR